MNFKKRMINYKLLWIQILLLLFPIIGKAQSNWPSQGHDEIYDTVKIEDILIAKYHIGDSKKDILPLFKRADSISKEKGVVDCDYTNLHFGKSEITLCGDKLSEFEIKDHKLPVSIRKKNVFTGMNDSIIKIMFPKSFSIRDTMAPNKIYIRVSLWTSQWLLFILNYKHEIKEIIFWEDNS